MIVFQPIAGYHAGAFDYARQREHAVPVMAGDRGAVHDGIVGIVVHVVADAQMGEEGVVLR